MVRCLPLALAFLMGSSAFAAPPIELTLVGDRYRALAPGAGLDFELSLTNHGTTAIGPVVVNGYYFPLPDDYRFSIPVQTDCFDLLQGFLGTPFYLRFTAGAIEPGQKSTCRLHVERAPDSLSDRAFSFAAYIDQNSLTSISNAIELDLGSFADVVLTSTLLSFNVDTSGQGHAIHRLTVTNRGPTAVDTVSASQCVAIQSGMTLHGDFLGACAVGEDECAAPLLPFFKAVAMLPALAAGASASCLVRLDGLPYVAGPSLTLEVEKLSRAGGATLIDPNPANNSAPLYLRALADVAVPTLSRAWLILLGGLVLTLGVSRWARRDRGIGPATRS